MLSQADGTAPSGPLAADEAGGPGTLPPKLANPWRSPDYGREEESDLSELEGLVVDEAAKRRLRQLPKDARRAIVQRVSRRNPRNISAMLMHEATTYSEQQPLERRRKCEWARVKDPKGRWFWQNDAAGESFWEDDATSKGWAQYRTEEGRNWWWHEASQRMFYEDGQPHMQQAASGAAPSGGESYDSDEAMHRWAAQAGKRQALLRRLVARLQARGRLRRGRAEESDVADLEASLVEALPLPELRYLISVLICRAGAGLARQWTSHLGCPRSAKVPPEGQQPSVLIQFVCQALAAVPERFERVRGISKRLSSVQLEVLDFAGDLAAGSEQAGAPPPQAAANAAAEQAAANAAAEQAAANAAAEQAADDDAAQQQLRSAAQLLRQEVEEVARERSRLEERERRLRDRLEAIERLLAVSAATAS